MLPVLGGTSSTSYNLQRSLRFRSSASAYLNRTMTTATDAKKWTWSGWVKRGAFAQGGLIASGNSTTDGSGITFVYGTGASLCFYDYISSTFTTNLVSTQVFRDPAAWYHIVVAVDTTQATASNRVKMYVNGTQITSFSAATYPALNSTGYMNSGTYATTIGREGGFGNYYDGYLAEVNFIDGQALTPSSFGSTNPITGVWQPAPYTGTYGTNGFELLFTDNSALTTSSNVGLGKDFSGNGNYWTTNNISITSGTTYDSMTDVPTLTSPTVANFCVVNPLDKDTNLTVSNGNLNTVGYNAGGAATFGLTSNKWYWEVVITNSYSVSGTPYWGIFGLSSGKANSYISGVSGFPTGAGVYANNFSTEGGTWASGSRVTASTSWADNDVIGLAFDAGAMTLDVYRNNSKIGSTLTVPTGAIFPSFYHNGTAGDTSAASANFGQRPFTYTPPTGYVALNTYNLPTSTIVKGNTVMDATLWTGTGSNPQVITNAAGFKPDLVWLKSRSGTTYHQLADSIRGANKSLYSNVTNAEETDAINGYQTAFNSNGFSVTAGSNSGAAVNANGTTYVGWQWQAGQGTNTTNTNGTITSTVSVNASAGFSVVTYTGTGANATVGHGLGVAPSLIIGKSRSGTTGWLVYHQSIGNTNYLILNATDASAAATAAWNNTSPTSSVFTIGTASFVNTNGSTQVAYCWTPIAGYSAFGSYTGNGSADGPFVYTGFRPKYVMVKSTSNGENWIVLDTARDSYNLATKTLYPNSSSAEETLYNYADILSNGFKFRTTNTGTNGSGYSFIYVAFAENPFKNALAR